MQDYTRVLLQNQWYLVRLIASCRELFGGLLNKPTITHNQEEMHKIQLITSVWFKYVWHLCTFMFSLSQMISYNKASQNFLLLHNYSTILMVNARLYLSSASKSMIFGSSTCILLINCWRPFNKTNQLHTMKRKWKSFSYSQSIGLSFCSYFYYPRW